MTRVSLTNDGTAVVVVEVLVDVVVLDMVVDGGIAVVVDGAGTVDEVVPSDVAVGVGALDAVDDVSDPDEHDNSISGATTSAHHHARRVIVIEGFNLG